MSPANIHDTDLFRQFKLADIVKPLVGVGSHTLFTMLMAMAMRMAVVVFMWMVM